MQLLTSVKSVGLFPPRTTEEICTEAVPKLVSVTICAPTAEPCVAGAKETFVAEILTAGVPGGGVAPVPVSCTDCGESGASSEITTEAVRWPAPRGEKEMDMEQEAFMGSGAEHELVN